MRFFLRILAALFVAIGPQLIGLYPPPANMLAAPPLTADVTITVTPLVAPTVTTSAATGVTDDSAVLNGTLNDGNDPCTLTWFWGLVDEGETESWTNNVTEAGQVTGAISQNVTGSLTPSTLYFFIVKAANAAGTDWGATANFTTAAAGAYPDPPTGFTLTDLGAITIRMDWVPHAAGDNVTIRVKRGEYPSSPTDGELAYSGNVTTTADVTGYALDVTEYFFRIWTWTGVAYSADYLEASIGGEGMTEIGTNLGLLAKSLDVVGGTLGSMVVIFFILGFTVIGFWKPNPIVFMVLAAVSLVAGGFSIPDMITSNESTTELDITLTIALIAYGLLCAAWALRLLFWRQEAEGG